MSEIPRIYADFNDLGRWREGDDRFAVPLHARSTVADLNRAGIRLRNGTRVRIYDPSDEHEDLEADGEARWVPEHCVWMAVLPERWRYVPRVDGPTHPEVPCLGCGAMLRDFWSGAFPDQACFACGTEVTACIAPPDDEPAAG
jgi:hypothetical protein